MGKGPRPEGLPGNGSHTAVRALAIMEPPWRCGARLVLQPLRKQRGSRGMALAGPDVATTHSGFAAAWPRWTASLALIAAGAVAARWVAMPQVFAVWALLLAALLLLWLVRTPASVAAPQHSPQIPDPVDVAMRTRLASAQAELSSLRGVQRELLAAKQAAEAAMLAKSEFLASMSHEIRTPLNGILPLLDIVLGTDLTPAQREYLITANASAKELLRIVDDILDYSKAEAGKLDLESVSINIRELVDSVKRLLDKPAEAKGLAMRAVVDADVRPIVRGDPMRVRQILTNLMSNAIKFTQRGGVSVRVSKRSDTDTQHELLFAVRDTGIGLAADAAARLFQPFTQADASVTRRYGGTGLGLTICKKLVDLMGGRIGVRSEPGRGSVFWFTVPFEKAPGDIAGTHKSLAGSRALLAAGPQRAQAITPVLATLELDTAAVTDTAAALSRLRQAAPLGDSFSFDLLLVDASSVAGDVSELLQSVLRERQLDKLRILALGVSATPDPRVHVAAARVDDATLRQGVRRVFGMAPQPRAQPVLSVPTLPTVAAASGTPQPLSGTVLLVEDHPVNQKVAQKLLERLGLTVDVADNGEIALEKLRGKAYAMVLMDCQMPVLDGYSATRRLREIENEQGKPRMPVIAMTAHAMSGDRERCLQAGMDDYLSKPLDRQLLEQTLARWMQQSPHAVAVPAAPVAVAAAATPPSPPQNNPPAMISPPPPDTLDTATLVDLEDIMGDELVTLVDAYLRDGETRMRNLQAAAERGDSAEVGQLAHSLKSSSANLGAMPLSTRARQVEEAARNGTLANPLDSVAALEKLYANAATALRQRYNRP
jgi:signal transduction histidine kinase/CheY-like chemotaxis protein/HPt (histidine-containing phosphotransfer) domain-containing protein